MAGQQYTQVQSKGIYHGLPVYPDSLGGLTAIITGANGISGHYMLRVLSEDPRRWTRIVCLSRRPPLIPGGLPANAEHLPIDFLQNPDDIAQALRHAGVAAVDHVFFFAYIQPQPKSGAALWTNAQELVDVNVALLQNFVDALKIADLKPKRFMLQTGAKNYGGHLGLTKIPQEEHDARVQLEPNFYYSQEDVLFAYSATTGCGWNVLMPGPIVGAVPDAAMNVAFPLAVYATTCRHLGAPLDFPGDITSWQAPYSMSTARMNAYMEEWAVLLGPANEKYNATDSSAFTWEGFWPKLAELYGIESRGPRDDDQYVETVVRFNPRGYGPKGVVRRRFRTVDWAKRDDVKTAWNEIATQNSLVQQDFVDVDRVFGFLDGSLCRPAPLYMSMDKSRKLGWHGFVDSSDAFIDVFHDLARLKMIPPVPNA